MISCRPSQEAEAGKRCRGSTLASLSDLQWPNRLSVSSPCTVLDRWSRCVVCRSAPVEKASKFLYVLADSLVNREVTRMMEDGESESTNDSTDVPQLAASAPNAVAPPDAASPHHADSDATCTAAAGNPPAASEIRGRPPLNTAPASIQITTEQLISDAAHLAKRQHR